MSTEPSGPLPFRPDVFSYTLTTAYSYILVSTITADGTITQINGVTTNQLNVTLANDSTTSINVDLWPTEPLCILQLYTLVVKQGLAVVMKSVLLIAW